MRHISTQVPNWQTGKNVPKTITLHSFQFENTDVDEYSPSLYGFSHGTSATGLRSIIGARSINCSFNIRVQQMREEKPTTGGDRGHAGQHTVYFRYVVKRERRTTSIPSAIVGSLGGVGGGAGYVLFVSLEKAFQSGLRFALAGGSDGIGGQNCFTADKMERSRVFFYRRKNILCKRMEQPGYIGNNDIYRKEYNRLYSQEFSEKYLGITQFEMGLSAAQQGGQGNEIGFLGNISLNNVEVIMVRNNRFGTISNYTFVGTYHDVKENANWRVYLRNGSNLQLNLPQPLPPLQRR